MGMLKDSLNKAVHAKSRFGGGGLIQKSNNQTTFDQTIQAELVIGSYQDGTVRILRDRYGGNSTPLSGNAPIDLVIQKLSIIAASSAFGENTIEIFKSGLAQEIEKSINETIERYHTKEVV